MTDITTREDIKALIDAFYNKVQEDDLLAPIFSHIDLPAHMPVMYDFWSSMLLGDQTYKGNPLSKHVQLPIQRQHFSQWLHLFRETVHQHFAGAKADEAIDRAQSIAGIFQHKMGL